MGCGAWGREAFHPRPHRHPGVAVRVVVFDGDLRRRVPGASVIATNREAVDAETAALRAFEVDRGDAQIFVAVPFAAG